jgi:cytochrome c-type biogenesis protein CcmH/NrfG
MLFDLRSRGRRRTVQVIYLGLAILIGGGLILFGVGTGTGGGGLLNGIGGNGSGSGQTSAVSQVTKAAERSVKQNPNSASAWAALVQAQWTDANQTGEFNASTATYTAAGKRTLGQLTQSWQHYQQLTKTPDVAVAILAARAYGQLGQYSAEGDAWENVIQAAPGEAKGYECLAFAATAAKQTRKATLAAAKAEKLIPKLQQLTFKQQLASVKSSPALAAQC